MNILELADILDQNIQITYYANQNGRFSAQFKNSEIKDGSFLRGTYGNGTTPMEALNDYVKEIRGQMIVFNAFSENQRTEYVVPKTLECY